MSGKFLDPLELEFMDGKTWLVKKPFNYYLDYTTQDEYIGIPCDFTTDFASIPRGLWNIFPPTGKYGKGAVVHDWLYKYRVIYTMTGFRLCERGEADGIFNQTMKVLGVNWLTRQLIHKGLRVGGWLAWNKYRKDDKKAATDKNGVQSGTL